MVLSPGQGDPKVNVGDGTECSMHPSPSHSDVPPGFLDNVFVGVLGVTLEVEELVYEEVVGNGEPMVGEPGGGGPFEKWNGC